MKIKRDLSQERKILSQIYSNNANTIKYLLFFFKDKHELIKFFDIFGGKTLKLPDTFDEFLQICLKDTTMPKNKNTCGINGVIDDKTKKKIIDTYLNLHSDLEEAINKECDI